MDLQYLSGFDDGFEISGAGDGMAELGKLIQRKMSGGKNHYPLKAKRLCL